MQGVVMLPKPASSLKPCGYRVIVCGRFSDDSANSQQRSVISLDGEDRK